MKIFNYSLLLIIIASVFSCSDLTELNEDPNRVTELQPNLLLTQIQRNAFQVDAINPAFVTRMTIGTSGEGTLQYYRWDNSKFDNYSNLTQITKMMQEAEKSQEVNYLAIGHFFKAYYFYELTMTFGDIPFLDALKGETDNIYLPKYDKQEIVFIGILKELDKAADYIDLSKPIKGDIIYNGEIIKWQKLINSFKLKVLLSLSHKTQVGDINIANEFQKTYSTNVVMTSNADSGQMDFYDQQNSRYSMFNVNTYNSSLYMSGTFIDFLKERKDPRLFIVAQRTVGALENNLNIDDFDAYNGGDPISRSAENAKLITAKNISKINNRYYEHPTTEAYSILSYAELEFILAEASARSWISSSVKDHYEKGISANFEFYATYAKDYGTRVDDYRKYFADNYLEEYLEEGKVKFTYNSQEEMIEQILNQKYIIMFHQSGWTIYRDYLRTGYPKLKQQDGVTPPTRWKYPTTEYNRNQKNLEQALQDQFGGSDDIRDIPWWLKK